MNAILHHRSQLVVLVCFLSLLSFVLQEDRIREFVKDPSKGTAEYLAKFNALKAARSLKEQMISIHCFLVCSFYCLCMFLPTIKLIQAVSCLKGSRAGNEEATAH